MAACAAETLKAAPEQTLKAVELANSLRAQLGTEVLACVRDYHGGLLSLLEHNAALFEVTRVKKKDRVTLRAAAATAEAGAGAGDT